MVNQSARDQRQRLLAMLAAQGSATTLEIRHELDILAPAPRIYELRHSEDKNICTTWDVGENPSGGIHRIARYTLLDGKYSEATNE